MAQAQTVSFLTASDETLQGKTTGRVRFSSNQTDLEEGHWLNVYGSPVLVWNGRTKVIDIQTADTGFDGNQNYPGSNDLGGCFADTIVVGPDNGLLLGL